MSNDGIRTVKTYGGKKIEVEDGFAVFAFNIRTGHWKYFEHAPDEAAARAMCDQGIMDGSFDAGIFVPAVFRFLELEVGEGVGQ